MTIALFLACSLSADPSPEQLKLLKVFRSEFIALTPGADQFPKSYRMGRENGSKAEQPVRTVTFNYPFSIAKYEVPQNLWTAVMGQNPSRWQGPRNSVELLTFDDAQAFCRKATELMRAAQLIAPDEIIRLPTEAEWEYATRAGTKTTFSFGDDAAEHVKYAWSNANAKGNDPPVGAKLPNPWGLYDVHGYLWEWCLDDWQPNYDGAPSDGSERVAKGESKRGVARGGSWKDQPEKLTSSFRQPFDRQTRDDALGLRCVLAKPR
jgi:formylglycine-generating enzyme required for sulfatase activity